MRFLLYKKQGGKCDVLNYVTEFKAESKGKAQNVAEDEEVVIPKDDVMV